MAVAIGVVCAAFALVGLRLWYLQVERGAQMRYYSEKNRIRLVRVPAPRGVVYDRNGEILVDNRPSFDVVFVPEDAGERRRQVLKTLAGYLGEEEAGLHPGVHAAGSDRERYQGIVLRRDVDWQGVVALETHQLDLPGVSLRVAPKRYYPFGPLAAHLLGYVGEVSKSELAQDDGDYLGGDMVGKAGLEKAFDKDLRGEPGDQQVEVDALGRRVRVLQEEPDRSGGTLTLTLDRDLQEAADRALGEADGAIVALDPRSGEVLAMVSHPAYDPNVFARGIRSAEWRALVEDKKHPLNNRAVQGVFPPGSTFKVAVATGALEEAVVTPFTGVTCAGGIPFGKHFFRCWKKGGHGPVNLHKAIVESCDVFFYQVGRRLGVDGIAEYAHRLGLGLPTGIALPHEQIGTIPDTEWKRRRFGQPWFEGETLSVAIGQGYVTATPLQMANLAATMANGGTRRRPFYVKRVVSPDGTVLEVEPEVLGEAHLKKSTLAQAYQPWIQSLALRLRHRRGDARRGDDRGRHGQEGARARRRGGGEDRHLAGGEDGRGPRAREPRRRGDARPRLVHRLRALRRAGDRHRLHRRARGRRGRRLRRARRAAGAGPLLRPQPGAHASDPASQCASTAD